MNQLKIVENCRDDKYRRIEYFNFISKVFPRSNFTEWYAKGFWTDKYIPFSIINDGKIISNVSAALMTLIVNGKYFIGVQLGAVGTLPEYRNQGLSRMLINYVIEKYKYETDIIFLFANDSVLEFYPKFGFQKYKEVLFVSETDFSKTKISARKLIIGNGSDFLLLQNLINERNDITKVFGAKDYGFITMWHILNLYRNNLYHLKEENAVFIFKEDKEQIHLYDIIFNKYFDSHSGSITVRKTLGIIFPFK